MAKVISIDLGTTNSSVAVLDGSKTVVIPNAEGNKTTPSVVGFTKNGERLIGQAAKKQAVTNYDRTIQSIKREMGSSYKKTIDNMSYTPQEISAMIISKLKHDAEDYLRTPVTQAVITVPACFTDAQRQATKDAARIAGLDVLRLINEPTAAVSAFGFEKELAQNILVFHLGGGTFDVSIINSDEGVFEVLATAGNSRLSGDDFDNRIVDYLVSTFKASDGVDLRSDLMAMQRLKEAAEKAKIELSVVNSTNINLSYITSGTSGSKNLDITLTRAKFNELTADLIKKTTDSVKSVMVDSLLSLSDIDKILMVGGSTRIPAVRDSVKNYFGKEPFTGFNPNECTVAGAAVQAGILTGDVRGILFLEATSYSLGIATAGGACKTIIPRNTAIPTMKSQTFSTATDNQTQVEGTILQGESELATDNIKLGTFILSGILPARKGVPKIEVTFDIDADGLFRVTAKDLATGKNQKITIQASSNMSEEDIQKAIKNEAMYEANEKAKKNKPGNSSQINLIDPGLPVVTEYDDSYNKSKFEEVINAVNQGDAAAVYELGSRYRLGVGGVKRDLAKAIELYKDVLKQQNNCNAFYHIGFLIAGGALGEQHKSECVTYYEAACETGSGRAAAQLGILYEIGTEYLEQNSQLSLLYYDKAKKLGNS